MNKFFSNALKIGTGIVLGMSMTAYASMTLLNNVYLNDEISISVNGQVKEMRDATTNEREYPLTYKGRTYIPLRSVATLLGYNVGYVTETNTATVDSPDYVAPAPSTNAKPTVNTISTSQIPLLKQYIWFNPNEVDLSRGNNAGFTPLFIKGTVEGLYVNTKFTSLDNVTDFTNIYTHPDSPFKEELHYQVDKLKEIAKQYYDNSSKRISVVTDESKIEILKYACIKSGSYYICRGGIARYPLTLRIKDYNTGKEEDFTEYVTSVFLKPDNQPLGWVCDIDA